MGDDGKDSAAAAPPAATVAPSLFGSGADAAALFGGVNAASLFGGVGTFPAFTIPAAAATSGGDGDAAGEGDGGVVDGEGLDLRFAPVTKLEPLEKVITGEEEEDVVYTCRAKMYWWGEGNAGAQWKERGNGEVKLLKHKKTNLVRLLMRRDKTMKPCANHILLANMIMSENKGSDRSWVYPAAADFSDGEEPVTATIAIRLKNSVAANEFKEMFEQHRDANEKEKKKNEKEKSGGGGGGDDSAAKSGGGGGDDSAAKSGGDDAKLAESLADMKVADDATQ